MKLNPISFGKRHRVVLDIYIDKDGIHDGYLDHPWSRINDCNIGIGKDSEVATIFGDEPHFGTYVLRLKRVGDDDYIIPLFGAGEDDVLWAKDAINHYSGRLIFKDIPGRKRFLFITLLIFGLFLLSIIIYAFTHIPTKL